MVYSTLGESTARISTTLANINKDTLTKQTYTIDRLKTGKYYHVEKISLEKSYYTKTSNTDNISLVQKVRKY